LNFDSCGTRNQHNQCSLNISSLVDLGCTINRVAIEGCSGGSGKDCKLKRGRNASIVVDLVPDFDSEDAKMTIYTTFPVEKAWPGMDTNACNYLKCPIVNGASNTYNFAVDINSQYPTVSV
jgi:hypothetical protein